MLQQKLSHHEITNRIQMNITAIGMWPGVSWAGPAWIRRLINLLLLLFMATQLTACVSTSAYETLYQQYIDVSNERDELIKKRDALAGNTKLLRNKVETTEEQKERLAAELKQTESQLSTANNNLAMVQSNLQSTNEELSRKNAALGSTNEELARRQQELLETNRRLAETDSKLKATADYMAKTNKLYDDLVKELSTELKANEIKIQEIKDGVTVNLSQDILFPSGSATLNDSGRDVIKKVSNKLKDIPHQIIVAGFTDNVPIKGDLTKIFPTNWELAGARAASVVRLLEKYGVDSDKMTAVSYGENKPVASNADWQSRKLNRRIEIRLRPVE